MSKSKIFCLLSSFSLHNSLWFPYMTKFLIYVATSSGRLYSHIWGYYKYSEAMPNDKNYLDCCFWLLPTGITFFFFIMTRQHCFRISAYINVGHNLRSYLKPRTYKIRISVRGISYCLQLKTIFTFYFLFYSIQIFTFVTKIMMQQKFVFWRVLTIIQIKVGT